VVNLNRQRVVNLPRREPIFTPAQGWSIWIGGDWSNGVVYPLAEHDYHTYRLEMKDLEITDDIQNLFNSNSMFVLFAGFGGTTGTNLTRQLSAMLQQNNKKFMVIYTMPFKFEGASRNAFALKTEQAMDGITNVHFFNLEVIRQNYGNVTLNVAFQKADEHCYQLFRKSVPEYSRDLFLNQSLPS